MRYWVYIKEKVEGPYEEDSLSTVAGLTPDTLICAEDAAGGQDWVKASSVFEFDNNVKTQTLEKNQASAAAAAPQPAADHFASASADESANQVLLRKIDQLTQQIQEMKGKLDEAVAASNAAQQAAMQQIQAMQQQQLHQAHFDTPAPVEDSAIVEDAAVTNTASLMKHAEQLVAQANTAETQKPTDTTPADQSAITETFDKAGEEVVLSSALDSLYGNNVKPIEEEKENTFQDLLSPIKTVATATAAGVAAGVAVSSISAALSGDDAKNTDEAQTAPADMQAVTLPVGDTTEEPAAAEPIAAEAPKEEPVAEQTPAEEPAPAAAESVAEQTPAEEPAPVEEEPVVAETPVAEEPAPIALSEENRENLIDEITAPAPAQHEDLIAKVLAEAEAEKQAQATETPADLASLPQDQEPSAQPFAQTEEKQSLDLSDQPQLNVIGDTTEEQTPEVSPEPMAQENPEPQPAPVQDIPELQAMGPDSDIPGPLNQENPETVKELVPGKKIEAEQKDDGIISQEDLDEAFAEHNAPTINDFGKTTTAMPESDQPLPEGQGFFQAKDMTEVELKEGSTYLISDFIPPAAMGTAATAAAAVAATAALDQNQAAAPAAQPEDDKPAETMLEEMVPGVTVPAKEKATEDITMSKISLENTIKTKRGATMDIKTVPIMKEPADSERLDLSDSDLDLNVQHDLQAAEYQPSGSKLTKLVFTFLISIAFLALIYVMLAYLEIVPAKFNVLKSNTKQAAAEAQMNEMFTPTAAPVAAEPLQTQDISAEPTDTPDVLSTVKSYVLSNGQTLEGLITSRHPAAQGQIEWSITNAVEPDNYSVLVKVPPENAQSFKISYRFNYNALTNELEPTISDSKNLLDSIALQ